jgi:hypothetical protein
MIPAAEQAAARVAAAQATDPERFRPTITIDTNDRRLRRATPERTGRVDTADVRELEASLRRRPWLVIAAAALITAAAVLAAQAFLRNNRPVPGEGRPASSYAPLPDSGSSLLTPDLTRALDVGVRRKPDNQNPTEPAKPHPGPVDIEVPVPTAPQPR